MKIILIGSKNLWARLQQKLLEPMFGKGESSREFSSELMQLSDKELSEKSTPEEWLIALENLHMLLRHIQGQIAKSDPTALVKSNVHLILAHCLCVDKILMRLKDNYINYRYRLDQFSAQPEILKKSEFAHINETGVKTYNLMLKLIVLMEHCRLTHDFPNAIVSLVHDLESECETLGSATAALNRFVYRHEALLQIAELEKSLLCSISRNEIMIIPNEFEPHTLGKLQISVEVNPTDWFFKLNHLKEEEHKRFIQSLIDIYHMLSNCYIISRRAVIKATFDNIAEDLTGLISCFIKNKIDNKQVLYHLHSMYNDIESLRFSANCDSRCSRNLFEKSKTARKLFRRACQQNSIACEVLEELVKPARVFKARR